MDNLQPLRNDFVFENHNTTAVRLLFIAHTFMIYMRASVKFADFYIFCRIGEIPRQVADSEPIPTTSEFASLEHTIRVP